jgi:hypothetical protein
LIITESWACWSPKSANFVSIRSCASFLCAGLANPQIRMTCCTCRYCRHNGALFLQLFSLASSFFQRRLSCPNCCIGCQSGFCPFWTMLPVFGWVSKFLAQVFQPWWDDLYLILFIDELGVETRGLKVENLIDA